ncbi:MAG: tetratricopeptide repeat protein [Chloracidobacterium sp.]|nr:tetratricopeptide repeat protein [Chloracidobacterium sp.]
MLAFFPVNILAQEEPEKDVSGAVELFQKAQDAHEKGDLLEAIKLYDQAIAEVEKFPEAELQKAHALLSLGRTAEAEKGFRRAVEQRPEWSLALANLGSILVRKGEMAEAERHLKKATEIDDQNSLALSALTELRLKNGSKPEELRELLTLLKNLTGKARPTASAWAARGALESALGERAAARVSFDRAIELDPKNQYAIFTKASAVIDEGDTVTAENLIRRLETIAPDLAGLPLLRARLAYSEGRSSDALSILDGLKDSPDAAALRDKIVLAQTDDPASLEALNARSPGNAQVLSRLCAAYRIPDPKKALDFCRQASELEPQNVAHAIGFAAALVQARAFEDAIRILTQLKASAPDNLTIRTNLATAFFQMNRLEEAKTEYLWIAEKQPSTAIVYYFLGITYDRLEEYMDAMANYQLFMRHADVEKNKLEIEKVKLRMPGLQKQIREGKSKKAERE